MDIGASHGDWGVIGCSLDLALWGVVVLIDPLGDISLSLLSPLLSGDSLMSAGLGTGC